MKLLLDTHAFLWWVVGDETLSHAAKAAIGDVENEVFVSAASVWEVTTKHRLRKLPHAGAIAADVVAVIEAQGFTGLSIAPRHAQLSGSFAGALRDPFDRMLIAQAQIEAMTLVSNETGFDAYGVMRLW